MCWHSPDWIQSCEGWSHKASEIRWWRSHSTSHIYCTGYMCSIWIRICRWKNFRTRKLLQEDTANWTPHAWFQFVLEHHRSRKGWALRLSSFCPWHRPRRRRPSPMRQRSPSLTPWGLLGWPQDNALAGSPRGWCWSSASRPRPPHGRAHRTHADPKSAIKP